MSASSVASYYELLGVPKNGTTNEIRQAFRQKALSAHPDRGGDPELFQAINKAYDVLSDPERRKYYDRTGRQERSVEEDFLEGFGRPAQAAMNKTAAPTVDDSKALQSRFTELQDASSSQSFEAWMRSRSKGGNVITTESLMADKSMISEDSYEKVALPKLRVTAVARKDATPEKTSVRGSSHMSSPRIPPMKLAAQCTEVTYPRLPKALDWKECLVHFAFAPLSPLDLFVARRGVDALFRDDLKLEGPHALGNSGLGIVETVGPGVRESSFQVGDWIIPARDGLGTFRSLAVLNENDILKVPKELMPVEYMACHRELCLAYYLMEVVASDLKAGDALIVNAANGAVGQVVIQLCRLMNVRAVAVVRRHDNFGDTKAWLEFLGAYKVFAEDEPITPLLKREHASLPRIAFDGIGGFATLKLVRSLAPGSTIVCYGFAGEQSAQIPWQVIVHSRVTIQGFDLLDWLNDPEKKFVNRKKMIQMLEQMAKLVNAGKLRISMEEMPLAQWFDALSSAEPGMNTKILLKSLSLEGEKVREIEQAVELDRIKKQEEERLEALRVASKELFLGPPWDISTLDVDSSSGLYEISPTKAAWQGSTLIWLHANGELPQEYTSLLDRHFLSKHPGVKIVVPTPRSLSGDKELVGQPDWFPLTDSDWLDLLDKDEELDETDIDTLTKLEAAADWIGAVVDRELRSGGSDSSTTSTNRVVLAGVAQGGLVALYAALTKLADKLAGVVTLNAPCIYPHFLSKKIKSHLRDTDIVCLAGANDKVFDAAKQRTIVDDGLTTMLPNLRFQQLAYGEHEVSSLEIEALQTTFATLVDEN